MFTKEMADQNRAMFARAAELLKDASPDTVANDHPIVLGTIRAEFPGVNYNRIWHQMARVLMQKRAEAIRER